MSLTLSDQFSLHDLAYVLSNPMTDAELLPTLDKIKKNKDKDVRKAFERYTQLQQQKYPEWNLSQKELLKLSVRLTVSEEKKEYLSRKTSGVAFSFLSSPEKGYFILSSRSESSSLHIKSEHKNLKTALVVPYSSCDAPNKILVSSFFSQNSDEVENEVSIARKFSGRIGHIAYFDLLTLKNDSRTLAKMYMGEFPHTFETIMDKSLFLSTSQITSLLCHVASGLDQMHKEGYIHGDLKPANVLFSFDPLEAVLCDYGYSCSVQEPNLPIKEGFYPSASHTAPELLGKSNFSGDLTKAESFAFGLLCYQILEQFTPHWCSILRSLSLSLNHQAVEDNCISHVRTQITQFCGQIQKEILISQSTPESALKELILQLLDLTPENRPTMAEARDKLFQITKNFS